MQNAAEPSSKATAANNAASVPCDLPQSFGSVEVRPAGAMGNGLFATCDIPAGSRILAETAMFALSRTYHGPDCVNAFCTELQRLSLAEKKAFDELYHSTYHITPVLRSKVREWYKHNVVTDTDGSVLKGKRLQDVSKATVKRFAKFFNNFVEMDPKDAHGGLFALSSRINHSCIPNAHQSYNPTIGRLTVHSIRAIRPGEQITVSYFENACRPKPERAFLLQRRWRFSCSCLACTDPGIENGRKRMRQLDQRLAVYACPLARFILRMDSPENDSEALDDAQELITLLKEQGLEEMGLCNTYRACSKFSLALGAWKAAKDFAVRELELERRLIGTETEHLGHEGAEFWLRLLTVFASDAFAHVTELQE
ncbi:TPR domain protein [Cordyceps militaris CM01]|uniref:TPR domain protein n=1 Tax=Cordyceps militaris (strain CM01) TaxID=983644 RepID=G3JIV7_CORMM|nr:TPR domain protein [Cordyceps militaris CM01]EGX91951.1 TPR domain protein [Cordyceps militaris CM01]